MSGGPGGAPGGAGTPEADRIRWNGRYRDRVPSFTPHPLAARGVEAGLPTGTVLELACGPSGSALALAASGRAVTAVDVSDVALGQLRDEAVQRGLDARLSCVAADAAEVVGLPAQRGHWAFVLATLFWDPDAYVAAAEAVAPGGLLGWEALRTADGAQPHPYRIPHGELLARLPARFTVVEHGASDTTTRILARAGD